jgi:hypothetical protein
VPTDASVEASPSPAGASVLDLADDIGVVIRRDVMDVPRLAAALHAMGWRRP